MSEAAELTYEGIAERAQDDHAFRDGLLAAAAVARAQGSTDPRMPPCPSDMAAIYIERLAAGEMP